MKMDCIVNNNNRIEIDDSNSDKDGGSTYQLFDENVQLTNEEEDRYEI